MSITTDFSGMEISVLCNDGFRRRIVSDSVQSQIALLLRHLEPKEVGDIRLNGTASKQVVVKPGVPLDLVAALVQRFEKEQALRNRGIGIRHAIVFTFHGESEQHYFVYETKTQIVVG